MRGLTLRLDLGISSADSLRKHSPDCSVLLPLVQVILSEQESDSVTRGQRLGCCPIDGAPRTSTAKYTQTITEVSNSLHSISLTYRFRSPPLLLRQTLSSRSKNTSWSWEAIRRIRLQTRALQAPFEREIYLAVEHFQESSSSQATLERTSWGPLPPALKWLSGRWALRVRRLEITVSRIQHSGTAPECDC